MKVGLVSDFYLPWIGGPSILIQNLSRGLSARGHEVHLLVPSATGKPDNEWDGCAQVCRIATVPAPVGHGLRVSLRAPIDAGQWLDAIRPDVVHVHHPFPIGAATVLAARRRGIPVLATNHTVPECSLWGMRRLGPAYRAADSAFGQWISFLLRRCTAVATPTATAARALPGLGYEGPVDVISNGIDTSRFQPGPPDLALRQRLGLDDRPVVLYTGRLDPEKQMDVWLRAASLLTELDVQFAVGGNGSDRVKMERMAEDLGIADRTRFFGYVDESELPDVYRLAAVYFISSPVELQSITTLEAVASGLPVVAADAMALPELVVHEMNGMLFPPGDAALAAVSLRRLLADPPMAREMGSQSRMMAENHNLRRTVDEYEGLLERTAMDAPRARHLERAASTR